MIMRLLIVLLLLAHADDSRGAQDDRSLRVRILASTQVDAVEFTSVGTGSLTIVESGQAIAILPAGEPAVVERWQGMLRVRWSRGSVPLTHCRIEGTDIIGVAANNGQGHLYRGIFEVTQNAPVSGGLQVINIVNIQHYVASVLPAEYPFTEIEGVKAQAIVIRTYAITASPRNGSHYSLRDDAGSQVYRGVETETDLSREVAQLMSGATLHYQGKPIEAVYSSHCGGHSADNEDIWGTNPLPYLRGRKDTYDKNAPVAEWSTKAGSDDVRERLSDRLGKRVKAFEVSSRGAGKHVKEVRLRFKDSPDETMRGERFRSILNSSFGSQLIRSSSFEIKKRSGTYHFKGKGFGHGVGFCQWGARAQAQEGRSYKDILRFYYKGVDVSEVEPESVAFHIPTETLPEPTGDSIQSGDGVQSTDAVQAGNSGKNSKRQTKKRRPGW